MTDVMYQAGCPRQIHSLVQMIVELEAHAEFGSNRYLHKSTESYLWMGRNYASLILILEFLIGRIYAKHATSYSWGGKLQLLHYLHVKDT